MSAYIYINVYTLTPNETQRAWVMAVIVGDCLSLGMFCASERERSWHKPRSTISCAAGIAPTKTTQGLGVMHFLP